MGVKYEEVEGGPREGMVVVHDSVTGRYLGCMGRETWLELVEKDLLQFVQKESVAGVSKEDLYKPIGDSGNTT
jgi:hypothetical protein